MNECVCWCCNTVFLYDGEKYQDVICPHCCVENSIYDPSKQEPQPKEEAMKPPKHEAKDFEKVAIGEMIPGEIVEINYDKEHKFKGFQGKEDTIQTGVRFKFLLENYQFPHYSRWFKFSYAEKSNLYKLFIAKLVENPLPDMDLDLDLLKGMKVKTLWNENGEFQNLESIFPAQNKIKATDPLPTEETTEEVVDET